MFFYHYRQHKKTDEIVHEGETSKAVTRYSYITVLFRTTTNIRPPITDPPTQLIVDRGNNNIHDKCACLV